jgi:hypothetical protein
MDKRRRLAVPMVVALCGVAIAVPALAPDEERIDPLAPIAAATTFAASPPADDEPRLVPLRRQASAALRELQASSHH